MKNVLRKSTKEEQKFLGVCSGIARYIDPELDPIIVRLTWVALSLFNPAFIVLYFIGAILMQFL